MRPSKRTLVILILVLFALGAWGRNLDEIKRSGKIYVAFTSDDLKNINYDLALEFARYLNVELIEVSIEWDEVFMRDGVIPEDLETDPDLNFTPDALKKADIICSTFTIIDWRKKLFGFAETLESAELLLIQKSELTPGSFEELSGKRIAYMTSTTFEQHLSEINSMIGGGIQLVPTSSSDHTKRLIQENSVYGIILDADEALNFNAKNGQKYKIAFPISDITKSAWAVDKNNPLIQEVENFFETIASNGILDEIFYRKFGITYSSYLDRLNNNLKLERYHRDLDEILDSRKLVVALRERNFIYRQEGQKQFMHALAEEFADYLGVTLEFVVTPYFGKYWETKEGEVYRDSAYTPEWFDYFDLACEVIAPLDWRSNKVNMVPVYPSAYAVVGRKDLEIRDLESLKKYRGVTDSETMYEDILKENGISNYYYERVDNFLPDVASGKADYTIIYNAFYELSNFPDLEVKMELGQLDVCWALRKDQPELQEEVEKFIERSQQQGLIGSLLKALRGNTLQAPDAFLHSYYESFQTGQLPYVNYGADDGLPQEDIFSIYQDHKGYLWFGTNSGAVRYNGREMVVFNHEQGLPGNSVRDIEQDSTGMMYFATTSGIAKFSEDTTQDILLEGISFNKIFIDSRNNRWFIGNDGVYVENRNGQVRHLNSEFPVLPEIVYHITEDPGSGNLLMATILGVFIYDRGNEQVTQLSNTDSYSLFIDINDSIWISTSEGLCITHLDDLVEYRFDTPINNLNKRLSFPVNIISDITTNKFGSVWLVTDSKIMQVISTDQEPIIYEQEIGIKNNKILSFLIDQEDNIWIGFSGGLQRLTNRRGLRNFYPGIIDSYIYSIFQDVQDRMWITSDNGIFYFRSGQLVNYTPQTGTESTKFTGTILPSGNILLANNEGLYEVSNRTLEIVRHTPFNQVAHSIENIFVTSRGEIFLLTGINGIIYYFPDFYSQPIPIKNRYTGNIFQLIELDGRIIGGNSSGFVVFNGSDFELLQETACNVWTLCKNGDQIWVGTDCGIGLVQNGRFDQVELSSFDRELVIKSILPAKNRNYLWLGTNKGFIYFNTETKEFEFSINAKDGLSGDEITSGGLFLDQDDLLWVGTYHGISNFNIRATSTHNFSPVCYIERMFLNGDRIHPDNGTAFAHNENNFVFEVSALSFSDETSVEYEYYLRGTGNQYSSYHRGSEYKAYYTNLPPGDYEFIYKAKGKNNIWGYAEKFEFTIRKAWYNTWIFRAIVITLFIGFTILFYRIRINTIKAQKRKLEKLVRERTHELEVANTEIEAQRDFARSQRDQIAQQQKAIMDSISYAQTIQNSMLPSREQLMDHLPEHFILFKPREIVSGDFYWVSDHMYHFYVVAADCTGHGVPGAFMSMLGITILQEIVSKYPQIEPDELLNEMRNQIMETLHQKGDPGEAKDGMDMVVCKYNRQDHRLHFAGANNPLYLVRDEELTEYKTDKMPVSIHEVMDPFTRHEVKLKPGDCVYIFSDGYADQFGGPNGKKLKYRPFKDLLISNINQPMNEQGILLDRAFEAWKGDIEQIDDVVVIGMRF
jgi:ligand-binding sensor domain-containing protein/serine phosphatase RsbU (regulator of sigma subunit)/ABC-type amino acid transport substrate-binding protein